MKIYIAVTTAGVIWFAGVCCMIIAQAGALLTTVA